MADAKTEWSFTAGEKGSTRVRAYDRGTREIFLEWWEQGPPRKRVRQALSHHDRERAKAQAEALALAFRREERAPVGPITLGKLFDIYLAEVTPQKGVSKQEHDVRAAEMFARYFGRHRQPLTLSRRDWDRFIADRRAGRVKPEHEQKARIVGDRVIAYDCKFLRAVLAWATAAGDGKGGFLLDRNPLAGCQYRAEEQPRRIAVTEEQYAKLREVASRVHVDFECLLVLAHETGHRLSAVRLLRWSDIDLEQRTITWRATSDQIGFEHTTPLSDDAVSALQLHARRRSSIGDTWLFVSDEDPAQPRPRITFGKWWYRAETLAKIGRVKGRGYHSLRQQFATELKATPLRDLAHLGGWKDTTTLLKCYQQPDESTQRRALESRRKLKAGGLE